MGKWGKNGMNGTRGAHEWRVMVFAGAQKFAYRMQGDEQQQRQQENHKQEEGSQAYTCAETPIHVSANYTVSCPMWLTLSEAECSLCTRRTLLLLRIYLHGSWSSRNWTPPVIAQRLDHNPIPMPNVVGLETKSADRLQHQPQQLGAGLNC